jgi:type IV fimbrial biogenesis protein FimT
MRHLNQRGLTLIELMVGLAIGAFLMMTAAPYFTDYITNSRLREAGNLLFAETLAAQSEAVKRNTEVGIETSGNTITLTDRSVPKAPVTLRTRQAVGNISYTSATLNFGSEGRPVPFGTAGSVNVSMGGVTCGSDYRCPGLRVDAGGAVRLCANQLSEC